MILILGEAFLTSAEGASVKGESMSGDGGGGGGGGLLRENFEIYDTCPWMHSEPLLEHFVLIFLS